jgi:ParB family transcriptional regulator, chromosome partitioning protein
MNTANVPSIPISEIKIQNPRVRNKLTFEAIVNSIATVGLKNPITVSERELHADGTRYDLVCGQGRIQAFLVLGETEIPAILIEASLEDQYLMSLIENIARRPPSEKGLINETKSLLDRGYGTEQIGVKLGLSRQYIQTIITLLKNGETKLLQMVEAGTIPITVATQIATGTTADVQRALTEAYEKGDLRGPKLLAARLLIKRRISAEQAGSRKRHIREPLTGHAAAREYQQHTEAQRGLVKRANVVRQRLALATAACRQLFDDENFKTLLRAEGLTLISERLLTKIQEQ